MSKKHPLLLRSTLALFLCMLVIDAGRASTGGFTQDHQVFLPLVSVNVYAPPMKVVETVLNRMKYGGYHLTANLQNQGPDPVYDVSVRADFFTEQGQWLTAYTRTAVLPANFPVISILWRSEPASDDSLYPNIGFELRVISWTLESRAPNCPLTVIDSHAYQDGSDAVVTAVFRNDSPYSLTGVCPLMWELHQPGPILCLPNSGVYEVGEVFTQSTVLWGVYGTSIPLIRIEGQGVAAP